MEFLNGYLNLIIVGLCLLFGFIVKKWVKDVDNKIIPTLCAFLGLLLAVWIHWGNITPEAILSGVVSGLAATGLHQAFAQLLNGKTE